MTIINLNFIMGVNVGFELFDDDEESISYVCIDLFILRIMIGRVRIEEK